MCLASVVLPLPDAPTIKPILNGVVKSALTSNVCVDFFCASMSKLFAAFVARNDVATGDASVNLKFCIQSLAFAFLQTMFLIRVRLHIQSSINCGFHPQAL